MNKYLVTLNAPANDNVLTPNGRQSLLSAARRWGADYIEIASPPFPDHHYRSKVHYDKKLPEGRICYVDGDVVLRDDCPSPFDIIPEGRLGLVRSHHPSHGGATHHVDNNLPRWIEGIGGIGEYDLRTEYPNTGFVVFDLPTHREMFDEARRISESHWNNNWWCADQGHIFASYKRLGIQPIWLPPMIQHNGDDLWYGWTPTMTKLGYHFCGPIDKNIGGSNTVWNQHGPDRISPNGTKRWGHGKPVCFIGGPELPFYLREVSQIHKGRCVEIGCLWGGLTWYGAQIAKDNFGSWVSCDSWSGDSPDLPSNWDWTDIKKGFDQNMRDSNLDDFVEVRHMKSEEAAALEEDNSLSLVFIDADHTYEGCKKDIELWWPKLKKGGVMLGHDYGPHFEGVVRAVDERFGSPDDLSEGEYAIWKAVK